MKHYLKVLCVLLVVVFFTGMSLAQSLEESLQMMLEKNAKGYTQPLITGFGAAINSGLYKKASVKTGALPIPIGIDVGLVTSMSFIPDEDKEFEYDLTENIITFPLHDEVNPQLPNIDLKFEDLYNADKEKTPNIASDEEGAKLSRKEYSEIINAIITELGNNDVDNPDQYKTAIESQFTDEDISNIIMPFQFPDGLNIPIVPVVGLQANVRIPFGIEISARALPEIEISEEIGKFKMYGLGLRKSVPVPIVDLSVGAFLQKMEIGDFFEANNLNFHAEAGKKLPISIIKIYPYAGIGMDKTDLNLKYTIPGGSVPGLDEDKELKFDIEGENKFRTTLGLTLQAIPFTYINLEGSVGKYSSATLSAGFIFK